MSDYNQNMENVIGFLKQYERANMLVFLCPCGALHYVSSKENNIDEVRNCECGKQFSVTLMEYKD